MIETFEEFHQVFMTQLETYTSPTEKLAFIEGTIFTFKILAPDSQLNDEANQFLGALKVLRNLSNKFLSQGGD